MNDQERVRLAHDAYTVAILCPLEVELSALRYMLDEEHEPSASHESRGDSNEYVFGKLSGHNVVIASLPAGQQGKVSAATVARDMARSYPSIVLRLLVGIGGGIPSSNADIRLGDVVITSPTGTEAGVVQYDLGKQTPAGFERKGILSPPASEWLAVLPKIQSDHRIRPSKVSTFISDMLKRFPMLYKYKRPPPEADVLFESDCLHRMKEPTCWRCDRTRLVGRPARTPDPAEPAIHYGLIASGDRVMKDAIERDRISNCSGAPICFDMEAAGLMNDFRCIVIRGISDYSDSHKNDIWHPYAAAAAAAFAKELLSYVDAIEYIPQKIEGPKTVNEDSEEELVGFLKCLGATNPQDDLAAIDNERGNILNGTCEWVCEEREYLDWINCHDSSFLKLTGPPGIGKTTITRFLLRQVQNKKIDAANIVALYYICDSRDEKHRNPINIIQSYLFQLLQKRPQAFARISKSYELENDKNAACQNINTLWRYFRSVLEAYISIEVIFFLDAFDETERDSRAAVLRLFGNFPQTCDTSQQIRVFVSTRPESDIEYYLSEGWSTLIADSEKIRADLGNFIADGVSTLATRKRYPVQLRNNVLETLFQQADGTFLWASFTLKEISRCRNYEVRGKLANLPFGLDEVYDRILRQIEPDRVDDAAFVLQWMVVSRRPITAVELATAYRSHKGIWDSLPGDDDIDELSDVFTSCESLLFINREKETISLVHQSVKDYLCSSRLRGLHDIGHFAVALDQANRLAFESCWDYFKSSDFNNGQDIIAYEDGSSRLRTKPGICCAPDDNANDDSSVDQIPAAKIFLSYAASYWKEHAVLSQGSTLSQPRWQNEKVEILPTIRDMWLYRVVKDRPSSSLELVRYLLKHGGNAAAIGEDDEYTPLHLAVHAGQYELVKLLLSDGRLDPNVRDGIGRTALFVAAVNLHGDIVRLLLDHGARKISTTARVCRHIPNMASQSLDDNQLFLEDGRIDFSVLENLLKTEGRLKSSQAITLIRKVTSLLSREPNVLKISGPVTICSDIYGQYYDLLKIFSIGGSITAGSYLFLGNYISRGYFSVECLLHLYTLKINHPDKVFLLRGGHECEQRADLFSFKLECSHKFDSGKVYQEFITSFRALPLAAVVDEIFLCLHGGPSPELTSLEDIDQLNRHVEPPTHGLICDILWCRPAKDFFDFRDFEYDETRIGFLSYYYSSAAVQSLLAKTGLTCLISRNEKSQQGHVSRLPWHISVFSAANYLDAHQNKGAILKLGHGSHPLQITQFDGSPHPYYLPNFMNGLEWSFPFVAEKIADMARFLAGTVQEGDENNKETNSWLLSEVVDMHSI